ncbi:DDE transposase [Neisseria meningitidis]|uniref:Transposase n=1 Tax=Neisseria meningitidis TaxID=487 RepID=A0A378VQJ4_NEIME|nr:transposase [Neisseria meningitidis 053442]AVI44291.1 DDE transposase [Neisseria meningitidis]MBW3866825.1 DDE transposase [Neisseria meningitidis]MBW3875311.1 DDE transposase [Neisseria meningitidis]OOH00884.1 DDE transposase [Neisseria meningitidis]
MRKSRLSRYKQNKLIELFVAGVTARTAAELVGVNKSTAAYYFHRLRLLIYQNSPHLEMFDGEVEADESYFAERQNHINGIENFWNQAKRHLRKFNGIPKAHFELYLKECEWRFNNSEIKVLVPY